MLKQVSLLVAGLISYQSLALANDTICSGRNVFYQRLQSDSGIRRTPATISLWAKTADGKVLTLDQSEDAFSDLTVSISNDDSLWSNGNRFANESVYRGTITIHNTKGVELLSQAVTCSHEMKMLP